MDKPKRIFQQSSFASILCFQLISLNQEINVNHYDTNISEHYWPGSLQHKSISNEKSTTQSIDYPQIGDFFEKERNKYHRRCSKSDYFS
jgi:hypothetical protein